jgi:choline dehydrogenase-like flavoprotein
MPRETNRVTLHPTEKDQFGLPIPNVHFDDDVNDIAMRNHAYKHGAMVYDAIGASFIVRTPLGPSTHNLGTGRLSYRPEDGVCNKWGQTHDIENLFISDGSQFTTSTAESPTLTIVALAIRQADFIADQMAKHLEQSTFSLTLPLSPPIQNPRPIMIACVIHGATASFCFIVGFEPGICSI